MMNRDTENTARTLVADGKGILAADETPGTLTRCLPFQLSNRTIRLGSWNMTMKANLTGLDRPHLRESKIKPRFVLC